MLDYIHLARRGISEAAVSIIPRLNDLQWDLDLQVSLLNNRHKKRLFIMKFYVKIASTIFQNNPP